MPPTRIQIGNLSIAPGYPVVVVAEVGVNHNGDLNLAKRLVKEAKNSGADCVKFQTFKAEQTVTRSAPKAAYQLRTTDASESQFDMLKRLELPRSAYQSIIELCKQEGLEFLSTPYSFDDVEFLESLGVPAFKVASGQIVEPLFLERVAASGKPIILSTGMATLSEVDEAVRTIRRIGNQSLVLLQCTTNYPSRAEDANLKAMTTMRKAFALPVGYSDHTIGSTAAIAAVALGACFVEKHFTTDRDLEGPDHSSSADATEFSELVSLIRETEVLLGTGRKEPCDLESQNIIGMRRSIVAAVDIPSGAVLSIDMLTTKRPGGGIPPSRITEMVGRVVGQDIAKDTLLSYEVLWNPDRKA